jgi:hypothetical protein
VERGGDMSTARCGLGVAVVDGKLYAVGGWDINDNALSSESFDPLTGQWSPDATMSTALCFCGVASIECPE